MTQESAANSSSKQPDTKVPPEYLESGKPDHAKKVLWSRFREIDAPAREKAEEQAKPRTVLEEAILDVFHAQSHKKEALRWVEECLAGAAVEPSLEQGFPIPPHVASFIEKVIGKHIFHTDPPLLSASQLQEVGRDAIDAAYFSFESEYFRNLGECFYNAYANDHQTLRQLVEKRDQTFKENPRTAEVVLAILDYIDEKQSVPTLSEAARRLQQMPPDIEVTIRTESGLIMRIPYSFRDWMNDNLPRLRSSKKLSRGVADYLERSLGLKGRSLLDNDYQDDRRRPYVEILLAVEELNIETPKPILQFLRGEAAGFDLDHEDNLKYFEAVVRREIKKLRVSLPKGKRGRRT